ncbi:putative membrane protein [Tamaricihabitans halophyticus]|uniref:Putative membrane protein n=1 Tax=Tamaricihabitans halophyticus TaxID=1262583 RepID=A0A4R2R4U2_9PSEU|nr:DUF1772 domain-containing protein [Tamaricihabitans halophyticus]TCP56799.1 putative membrane protein [Tamaricihabitans halophyticus]
MIVDTLGVLALLGSGVTAGVLFAVALSVLPALQRMPADRYVYAHQLIGRNWDPTMPIVVLTSVALDMALAAVISTWQGRLLAGSAAVLLFGVSVVSHLCNVPLNRQVKKVNPDNLPRDWWDPRPLWRRWHLLRTGLALTAFVVNAALVAMA